MIVVSMALTGLAIVLLVIGLAASSGLAFIYASIVVSVVAFVPLGLGFVRQRGAVGGPSPFAADGDAGAGSGSSGHAEASPAEVDAADDVRPVPVAAAGRAATPASAPDRAATATGTVMVVPGRPRYHVAGCRYLSGKPAEERPLDEARDAGFTACGVCRPDEVLADREAGEPVVAAAAESAPTPVAEPAPAARRVASRPRRAAAAAAPTADAVEGVTVLEPEPLGSASAGPETAEPETDGPETAETDAVEPELAAAPAGSRRAPSVVAVRTRFHRPECRFASVAGAETVSKATARRRGLTACGVCKP